MSTTQHRFDSTSDAYDATQCDETIRTGHALIIESERVIGIAWTWPVAVTAEHGVLHSVPGDGVTVIRDAGWTAEQIRAAVAIADEHAYPIAQWARTASTDYRQLAQSLGFEIQDTDEGYTWTARHFAMSSASEFDSEREAWENIQAHFPQPAENTFP